MPFEAKTEEELNANDLLPENTIVDFEVLQNAPFGNGSCDLQVRENSKGDPMIVAPLQLYNDAGNKHSIAMKYLTVNDNNFNLLQLKRFCQAVGKDELFEAGDEQLIANSVGGLTGKLKVSIEKSEGYSDKNGVKEFIAGATTSKDLGDVEDGVPF